MLGVSHRVGSDLCHWIVTESGKTTSKMTVQHVAQDDCLNPDIKKKVEKFNEKLEE